MTESERLEAWRDYDTYDNLLEMRDGPFNEYGGMQYFNRDGKNWVRMKNAVSDSVYDIELLPSG